MTGESSEFRWLTPEEQASASSLRWSTHPPQVVPLDVAEMGCALSSNVRSAVLSVVGRNDLGYAPIARRSSLPAAVVGYYRDQHDWVVPAANVVPIANSLWGVASCLLEARVSGVVAALGPLYPGLREAIEAAGCVVEQLDLGSAGESSVAVDLETLDHRLASGARAVVTAYPHSPTGAVWEPRDADALLSVVERWNVPLIVDEVYGPLAYASSGYLPLGKLASERCTVYSVGSVSKPWDLASLKAGWIVCPSTSAAAHLLRSPTHVQGQLGALATTAAVTALEDHRWLAGARRALEANVELWMDVTTSACPAARQSRPCAGMFVWMELPGYEGRAPLSQAVLKRSGVALGSGVGYCAEGTSCVRVNIALEPSRLAEAAVRVSEAMLELSA